MSRSAPSEFLELSSIDPSQSTCRDPHHPSKHPSEYLFELIGELFLSDSTRNQASVGQAERREADASFHTSDVHGVCRFPPIEFDNGSDEEVDDDDDEECERQNEEPATTNDTP